MNKMLPIIGRVEQVKLIDHIPISIPAKVDTGADLSSIWATSVKEENGKLNFVLFGKKSRFYTGEIIKLSPSEYKLTRIANSFGDKEMRYVVKLPIKISDQTVKTSFTLANRSRKTYPILLGRRLLYKKFLVDVSKGAPLIDLERQNKTKMHQELDKLKVRERRP